MQEPDYNAKQLAYQLQGQARMNAVNQLRPRSLKESLSDQLLTAKANVSRLVELLALLEEHPEVDRILELMGQSY